MARFTDILYGEIQLPDWIVPFIKIPEFLRLRGVRLSNVDSYQFKDFNGPARWEHSIAVAYLAQQCALMKGLSKQDTVHLMLAALLHDIATPPFAHTAEFALENFDHEISSQALISGVPGKDFLPEFPIYSTQVAQFDKVCKKTAKALKICIDAEEIARMVVGQGDLGYLIHGSLDLDNADNVLRAGLHLGLNVDKTLPLRLAEWLAEQKCPPVDLENYGAASVKQWIGYRNQLYQMFYLSSDEELARQAFLQHIMRRALKNGFPRMSLIWNTDDALLLSLQNNNLANPDNSLPLAELVIRYKLLESPIKFAHVDIENEDDLRILKNPRSIAWIEEQLSANGLEAMVMVYSRRYHSKRLSNSLFKPSLGALLIFKLGQGLKKGQLPDWLNKNIPSYLDRRNMYNSISYNIQQSTQVWIREKPWKRMTSKRKENLITRLNQLGDWSFRLSRNDNLHSYPATFVHSIPANIINSLGIQEELIIDPFGGTGQTATEVIKCGGKAITTDNNSIASLTANSKLTFLPTEDRRALRKIELNELCDYRKCNPPKIENIEKWFHPRTLEELSSIWMFIRYRRKQIIQQFLTTCFSAILVNCTARKGKQHGYFADNTPLPKGTKKPPYQDPFILFLSKIKRNLDSIERFYAYIERDDRDPSEELKRVRVLKLDATSANPDDYGIAPNSAGAIITSPPYLCMADYTLGHRLSYYWIYPELFEKDFASEIGARRLRGRSADAAEKYFDDLRKFAQNAKQLLRKKGFLATVLGAPLAKAFKSIDVFGEFDSMLKKEGFALMWECMRPVNWHRNHGYSRLKEERISIHISED